MTWDSCKVTHTLPLVRYNQRKVQVLELFAREGDLRPDEVAVYAGLWDRRCTYAYLRRLHRFGYLRRRRDFRGRLSYQLSGRGAWWLSKNAGRW